MPPQGQQTTEDVLKRLARMGLSMPSKSAPPPEPRPSVGTLLPAPEGPMLKIPERPSSEGPASQFSPGLLGTFQRLLMGAMEAGGSAIGTRDPLDPKSTKADIFGGLGGALLPVAGAVKAGRRAVRTAYPLATEWHGDMNFAQTGGRMVEMSPDDFLRQSRPLEVDDVARENIDLLKKHISEKGELDPLALYGNGKEDGRHRAIAAKELGIKQVPVLTWRPENAPVAPLPSHVPTQAGGTIKQALSKADDYRGQHTSPGRDAAPLHDLTGGGKVYPDDVYSKQQRQYYGDSSEHDAATFRLVNYMKDKPEAPVTVFRAVPKDAPDTINPGDWVTINHGYAKGHGEGPLGGDYKIISKQVKASDIFTNGDSIHEWGYHPAATQPMPSHQQAGGTLAQAMEPITAYHGSPHDFDKFSLSKIGTGEGAQAYGHGLYFAENEGVARDYRNRLSGSQQTGPWSKTDPFVVDGKTYQTPYEFAESFGKPDSPEYRGALEATQAWSQHGTPYVSGNLVDNALADVASKNPTSRAYGKAAQALATAERPKGRMYEVGLHASPDDFLDWDKPLSQQSEKVRQAVTESFASQGKVEPVKLRDGRYGVTQVQPDGSGRLVAGVQGQDTPDAALKAFDDYLHSGTGMDAYWELGRSRFDRNPAKASEELKKLGIKGIRYLDQGSRQVGAGTSNYVVFDEDIIEIRKKFLAMLAAGAGAAAAKQAAEAKNKKKGG